MMKLMKVLFSAVFMMTAVPCAMADDGAGVVTDVEEGDAGALATLKTKVLAIPSAVVDTVKFYNPVNLFSKTSLNGPSQDMLQFLGFLNAVHLLAEDPATLVFNAPVPMVNEALRHGTQALFFGFLWGHRDTLTEIGQEGARKKLLSTLMKPVALHWACDITMAMMQYVMYPGEYDSPIISDPAKGYKRIGLFAIAMTAWTFHGMYKVAKSYQTPRGAHQD